MCGVFIASERGSARIDANFLDSRLLVVPFSGLEPQWARELLLSWVLIV